MSDILIALAYAGLLLGGLVAPFVTAMGYVWVDSFYPQYLSRLLMGFPVAAAMGVGALLSYVLMDRKAAPRIGAMMVLVGALAAWMTITLAWAVRPESAWDKWDWAFKAALFAGFIPFVFRSRVQIEALLQAHMLGSGMHVIAVGIKGAITGGGYQWRMTALPTDQGLGESSALATVAIMFIPLLLYMRQHSILVPFKLVRNIFYPCYALLCVTAMIGTGARTGVVCLVGLCGMYWLQSRYKTVGAVAIGILGVMVLLLSPDRWRERMTTIGDYQQEASALTRIKVWEWILGFVADHPLGGGFRAYQVNVIYMPPDAFNPDGWVQYGRAPHSTWFEILSELGWPGFLMFVALIGVSFLSLWRVWKRTKGIEELLWARDLARALAMSLMILMAGSTFIGIGFQPWYWLMFAVCFCLSEHVRRCLTPEKPVPAFLQAVPSPPAGGSMPVPGLAARRRA